MEPCGDIFEIRFLFSAFSSAVRSVTFCMQATLSDLEGFKEWYEQHQSDLKKKSLARFFLEARNISQKVGAIPISYGSMIDGKVLHYFDSQNPEFKNLPEQDVISSCQEYFKTILKIVYDSYVDFGHIVDPHQYYTKANFLRLGLNIDDLDEEQMGIRGWPHVPEWPEAYRWESHRRNISGCRISEFFHDYLNFEKPHPPKLPEDPNEFDGVEWIPPALRNKIKDHNI